MVNTIMEIVDNFSISGAGDDGSGGEDSASSKRKRFGGCDDSDVRVRRLMYKRYKKTPSKNVVEPTILVKDLKNDSKSLSSSKVGPKNPSSEVSRPSRIRVESPPSSKVTPPSRFRVETFSPPKVTRPSRFRVETFSPPKVTPPSRFRVEYSSSSKPEVIHPSRSKPGIGPSSSPSAKVAPPSRFRVEYPSSSKLEVIHPSRSKPRSGPSSSPSTKVVTISKFKPGLPPPASAQITPASLIPTYASKFRPGPCPSLKERAARLLEECSGENDVRSSNKNLKLAPP